MKKAKQRKNLIILFLLVAFVSFLITIFFFINQSAISQVKEMRQKTATPITVIAVRSRTIRLVSAYNVGDRNQTDSTPCISANGENICLAVKLGYNRCASNFVPFGTDLLIQAPTGWHIECKVVDRLNKKYSDRVDIAMPLSELQRARNFGVQRLVVSVLGKKTIIKPTY